MGGIPPTPLRDPHQRVWPGGRGTEGRGDIIRAAPPSAATSPQAPKASMTSPASSPLPSPPGPQQLDASPHLPSFGSCRTSARCSGRGGRSLWGGVGRRCGPDSLTCCLRVRLRVSGAVPPARLAGAARSPPGGARGAGPAPLRAPPASLPGPAHPRLRQTPAPPQTRPQGPPIPAQGREQHLNPSDAGFPPAPYRHSHLLRSAARLKGFPEPPVARLSRPLGSAPSLSNKSSATAPSWNHAFLAAGGDWGAG